MKNKIIMLILISSSIFSSIKPMEMKQMINANEKSDIEEKNSNQINNNNDNNNLEKSLPLNMWVESQPLEIWNEILINNNLRLANDLIELKTAILAILKFSILNKKCNLIYKKLTDKVLTDLIDQNNQIYFKNLSFFFKYKISNEIKILLQEKGFKNIDSKNVDDLLNKALLIAADKGFITIAKLAIKFGAKIDAMDMWLNTSLIRAVVKGRTEIVKLLLEHGANVNFKTNHWNETALIRATHNGDKNTVEILLQNGADKEINYKDRYGYTALKEAMHGEFNEIVNLLKQYGAEIL